MAAVEQGNVQERRAGNGGKRRVTHAVTSQHQQVACRAVSAVGGQPVRVGEMGAVHTQVARLLVHHLAKIIDSTAYMLRNGKGGIVVALKHHLADDVAQKIPVAKPHTGVFRPEHILGNLYGIAHFTVFQGQHARHHLRQAGREHALVGVLRRDEQSRGVFNEHPRFGRQPAQ